MQQFVKAQTCCFSFDHHPALITTSGCFQTSRKGLLHLDSASRPDRLLRSREVRLGEQSGFPVPPKLRVPVIPAGQGPIPAPTPAPQPPTELPFITASTLTRLSCWRTGEAEGISPLLSPSACLHRGRR